MIKQSGGPSRREFLGGLALACIPAALIRVFGHASDYIPTGHVVAGDAQAMRVDYVTLNGARVENVIECNDVEGWLRRYVDLGSLKSISDPQFQYRTGQVRIHWLAAT